MMKKPYKKAIAVFAAIMLCLSVSPVSRGQYQTPSYVRVGLYYKDSTSNTALSVFNVSAANGIQAGYFKDNNFTELYGNTSSATCYVRKDALYYNAGGTLKEYTASGASAAASYTKYGPYHIKIGSDYPGRETAEAKAEACRSMGVRAYIAYADAWQVWSGDYTDSTSAEAGIAGMTAIHADKQGKPMLILDPFGFRVLKVRKNEPLFRTKEESR
jgi:stage II sporulation protein D